MRNVSTPSGSISQTNFREIISESNSKSYIFHPTTLGTVWLAGFFGGQWHNRRRPSSVGLSNRAQPIKIAKEAPAARCGVWGTDVRCTPLSLKNECPFSHCCVDGGAHRPKSKASQTASSSPPFSAAARATKKTRRGPGQRFINSLVGFYNSAFHSWGQKFLSKVALVSSVRFK
jgi:hypothetical protein